MQKGLGIQGFQMCNVRVGSLCLSLLYAVWTFTPGCSAHRWPPWSWARTSSRRCPRGCTRHRWKSRATRPRTAHCTAVHCTALHRHCIEPNSGKDRSPSLVSFEVIFGTKWVKLMSCDCTAHQASRLWGRPRRSWGWGRGWRWRGWPRWPGCAAATPRTPGRTPAAGSAAWTPHPWRWNYLRQIMLIKLVFTF